LPTILKINTLPVGYYDAGGIKGMLAVAEINYIRHGANSKDRSYSEIAKRVNRDYRTVKKYAEQEDFSLEENQNRTDLLL